MPSIKIILLEGYLKLFNDVADVTFFLMLLIEKLCIGV